MDIRTTAGETRLHGRSIKPNHNKTLKSGGLKEAIVSRNANERLGEKRTDESVAQVFADLDNQNARALGFNPNAMGARNKETVLTLNAKESNDHINGLWDAASLDADMMFSDDDDGFEI